MKYAIPVILTVSPLFLAGSAQAQVGNITLKPELTILATTSDGEECLFALALAIRF